MGIAFGPTKTIPRRALHSSEIYFWLGCLSTTVRTHPRCAVYVKYCVAPHVFDIAQYEWREMRDWILSAPSLKNVVIAVSSFRRQCVFGPQHKTWIGTPFWCSTNPFPKRCRMMSPAQAPFHLNHFQVCVKHVLLKTRYLRNDSWKPHEARVSSCFWNCTKVITVYSKCYGPWTVNCSFAKWWVMRFLRKEGLNLGSVVLEISGSIHDLHVCDQPQQHLRLQCQTYIFSGTAKNCRLQTL